jgi:hypothetical protein
MTSDPHLVAPRFLPEVNYLEHADASPWWPVAALAALAVTLLCLAYRSRRRRNEHHDHVHFALPPTYATGGRIASDGRTPVHIGDCHYPIRPDAGQPRGSA